MRGHSHALSGLAAGAAAGELAGLPLAGTMALSLLTGAFATVPDIDTCDSCAARSLGPLSEGVAWAIAKVSGGHRHATHSMLGVTAFTAAAWAAVQYRNDWPGRIGLAFLLVLAIAALGRAMYLHGYLADAAGLAGAGAITLAGWQLGLVAAACGLGCLTHVAGDALTTQGVPLAWPVVPGHVGLPRPLSFVTGSWRERRVVVPLLLVAIAYLAWHEWAAVAASGGIK